MSTYKYPYSAIGLMRICVAAVWLVTGVIVLWIYPIHDSLKLVYRIGLQGNTAIAVVYAGALLDIVMGMLSLARPRKSLWLFQIAITLAYSLCIAAFLPEFLIHPFGPVLKNLPFLAMLWMLYSQSEHAA